MKTTSLTETWKTLDTYGIGASPTVPIFYEGRGNQGAQGHVYPYPLQDKLTADKAPRKWRCVVMENEYVRYEILPDLGGRIVRALDKTNNYDFFYRQDVVKPALIGVLGAWMSGGVEWNFPHHHRTTTFMPADYRIERGADGSATVWIAETEKRHRMRSEVGLCLKPDTSCLEVNLNFRNDGELPQSFLYWANAAVHANEQYQVIFPPDVYYAIHHAKDAACSWPKFDGKYKGIKFDHADISWWKVHPAPASFFCGKSKENFFGGYDHGKNAGVVIWADRHYAEGKKFFLWGNNETARVWDQILTDNNGPYLELMAGSYSDNQPDYTWLQPGEVKHSKQYFFPVHDLDGFNHATPEAAVNVQTGKDLRVSCIATKLFEDAKIEIKAADKCEKLTATLAPDQPFSYTMEGVDAEEATVTLWTAEDRLILTYYHHKYPERPMPTLTVPPPKPEEFKTIEELYLAGQRLEQFHNSVRSADPYYAEALKRDPDDYRTNIAVGVRLAKRGLWADAETHFRKALARAEYNNTTPQDGAAYYELGVALKAQDKFDEAEDMLKKALWYPGQAAAAALSLAELLMALDRKAEAAAMLEKAPQEAAALLKDILAGVWHNDGFRHCEPANIALENAAAAIRAHQWQAALAQLEPLNTFNPLVYYYRGYCQWRMGYESDAKVTWKHAHGLSSDYCFPFRWETEQVLKAALEANPKDFQANYLLGCLMRYYERMDEAFACWEKAAKDGSKLGNLYYCLGHEYDRAKRLDEAKEMLLKAIKFEPNNPIFVREYDKMMESQNESAAARLAFLQERQNVVDMRDDVLLREIVLLNREGEYDKALELIGDRRFYVWEGNEVIVHDAYAEAHLERGKRELEKGTGAKARKDFEAALLYPVNLGVGRPYRDVRCRMTHYLIGKSWQLSNKPKKAQEEFELAVADMIEPTANTRLCLAAVPYYQALALQELGRGKEAKAVLKKMEDVCKTVLGGEKQEDDFFAKFAHDNGVAPKQKVYLDILKKVKEALKA